MYGLPLAILAPEDQRGSDHQLDRLRATLKLPPPALDEDPVGHGAVNRQEGTLARDLARTRHELRSDPLPAFADLRPATRDAARPDLPHLLRHVARVVDAVGRAEVAHEVLLVTRLGGRDDGRAGPAGSPGSSPRPYASDCVEGVSLLQKSAPSRK